MSKTTSFTICRNDLDHVYKVEKINNYAYGVYKKNIGASGGWHLIKTFHTEEEAHEFIRNV